MTAGAPEVTRTAASIIAAQEARDRDQRRRFRRMLGVAAAITLGYALACHPRYQGVRVSASRSVDVISVARDGGIGRMFGAPGATLGPALVVSYYSSARGRQGQGLERLDIFEWARPQAERLGLGAVVLWRTEPVVSRWLPLVRGDVVAFRRKSDGTWGSL